MNDSLSVWGGRRVLVVPGAGEPILGERGATDLIGQALGEGAEWVAVPAARLGDDFFRLSTRIAGEMIQKFVNYRVGLAVVGDISAHVAASDALRDFVHESNQAAHLWFVDSLEALEARLGG